MKLVSLFLSMFMRTSIALIFMRTVTGALLLAGLSGIISPLPTEATSEKLVVYSGRKEKAIKPVVEAFTRQTGVQVDLKVGMTSGLANAIRMERANPRGDVFIATEGGVMELLAREGLLEPYRSPATKAVPDEFKSATGAWTGISGRARILLYNKNLVAEQDVPRSIFELTDPKWKGKLAIAGTRERTTLSWVSALVAVKGEAFTRNYIKGLMANELKILADNTEVWQGVGHGEFAVGLTNSPNYYLAKNLGLQVGVVYPDQGPAGFGTLINPNAAAVIKGSANPDAARKFIDFLLSPEGQRILVTVDYETPVIPAVDPGEVLPATAIKQPAVNEQRLADLAEPTLALLTALSPAW